MGKRDGQPRQGRYRMREISLNAPHGRVTHAGPKLNGEPFAVRTIIVSLGLVGSILVSDAQAQILGTAEDFGVLAGTTVTNTGPSVIMGNVGVSPGIAIVGFPPGIVVPPGTIHAGNAVAAQAQVDLTTAYNTLQGLPSQVDLTGQNLGGQVLLPAVYSFATSAQLTGVLTLNGQGNTASQFVFQIGSTLTTASNSAVLLINGANGNNVYWAVGSSATLGTNSVFAGNIVALTSITLNTGASITCGRALARNGAVTLDNNTITLCAPAGGGGGGGEDDIPINDVAGEGVTGTQQTAINASKLFGSTLMNQAALGFATPQTLTGKRSIKDDPVVSALEGTVVDSYRTWRLWTTGFGGASWLGGDAVTGSGDLTTRTAGFAVGFDRQLDHTARVGIAVGYTNSAFSVDERLTNGSIEGVHVGLYGVKHLGSFYLAATAEYAFFHNTTDRFIDWVVDERAHGNFASEAFSTRFEGGWKRSFGAYNVTPFAGLQVSHLTGEGFTEHSEGVLGGPGILGLTFGSHSVTSVESSLGIQVDTRIPLQSGQILTPFARIAWVHEFNPERSMNAGLTFSPAATFSPQGALAASDVAKVNAGLRLDVTERMGLYAYFEGEFSDHSHSYAGNGGFRISW
jgi:outer membrane autotransporter protein